MTYLHSIILSFIEGLTEFLPVSSTGHLILTARLLSIPHSAFINSYEIIIQLGAILAVVILYGKTFIRSKAVWIRVIAAFIPTGIIGFILYKFIKVYLIGNELITLVSLFIGGIILIIIEKYYHPQQSDKTGGSTKTVSGIEDITLINAIIIGLAQSLAVVPGVSRAAATIIGARLLGVKRETAVIFSFLLAVPTIAAAAGFDLLESNFSFNTYEYSLLAVGFFGSFIVAVFAVKLLVNFTQKHTFIPFGIYRIILAVIYWLVIIK